MKGFLRKECRRSERLRCWGRLPDGHHQKRQLCTLDLRHQPSLGAVARGSASRSSTYSAPLLWNPVGCSRRNLLTGSPELSGSIHFSHNHFYVDSLKDLEEYKQLESRLNEFAASSSSSTSGPRIDVKTGAASWVSLRDKYGDPVTGASHLSEYSAAQQDLVEQLLVGLGWRITGVHDGKSTRSFVVTSKDPEGVKFVITAHKEKRIDNVPINGASTSPSGACYDHFDAVHLERFGQYHHGRQGCAVLGFSVGEGEVDAIKARYQQLHPKLLVNGPHHVHGQENTKILEVFAYYTGEKDVSEADEGTIFRFMECKDSDFWVLPGITKVEASYDGATQPVFCDHWVSNVHSRTGFLETLNDTLGFAPKVDFNAGVVAAGEAQIESTVTGNTSAVVLDNPNVALRDQSQIYLPINNALSEVGHVNTFLKEIGQGVQHVASRVPDLIMHISRANDYRKMTGAGLSFLQIPRSYYGRLLAESLAQEAGISVDEARQCIDSLRLRGVVDSADVVDLDAMPETVAAALPSAAPELISAILKSRYANLYALLRDHVSEEKYLDIIRNNILVDVQGSDLLLQIFTSKILTRSTSEEGPFLEFIQRVCSDKRNPVTGQPEAIKPGCGGFGIRNFLTLFLSIEVTEASNAREAAHAIGDERGVIFGQRMVDAFTEQLNESNPILTRITDAMTAEGDALARGDSTEEAKWSREKDMGQKELMELSVRYKDLTRSIREERAKGAQRSTSWTVRCGDRAAGILNPIREIMDTMGGKSNPEKPLISLAQGDPTCYPHLRPPNIAIHEVVNQVYSGQANGYQPSQGHAGARAAIASEFSVPGQRPLKIDDIFMTIGCSEALNHCIAALAFTGANMLLPRPGFPLYQVLCDYHGVECRYYDLHPEKNWEIDIDSVKALADENTTAVLVNNPSNPCGAVFSRKHLTDVMDVAEDLRLPIIADEVYHGMSFGDEPFVAMAEVSSKVPVLSVCALSKRWLAPGWRVGWITLHDNDGILERAGVHATLLKLCQVSLGPTALVSAAIPRILEDTPEFWMSDVLSSLKDSAEVCQRRCRTIPGLEVASDPQGAMYFMMRIRPEMLHGIDDDVSFARALLSEESIAVLPGQCFNGYRNYARVVFAAPVGTLEDAWDRIEAFCRRRAVDPSA